MKSRQTIAAKIFGLSLFLLLITIVLVIFLLVEIDRTRRNMDVVASHDMPITNALVLVGEFGLRRRIAFERLNGTLDSQAPNEMVISEAGKNYALFTTRLDEQIKITRKLMAAYPPDSPVHDRIVEAKILLDQIDRGHNVAGTEQKQVLALQKTNEHGKANALLNFLNDNQRTLQSQSEMLVKTLQVAAGESSNAVANRHGTVMRLAIAATVSAILLGLIIAAFITRRLVAPLRSLVSAVHDVEKGNLHIQIPILTTDEVGQLAGSFNHFVGELRAKDEIKKTFGKYIDPRVMEQVLAQNGVAKSLPERRVMTVMFADLVGFTSLSEQLTASRMVDLLNRHFGLQAAAVQEYGGVVDKFIGDAVMAFWGPPFVSSSEQATLACRAAITQVNAMETLRGELAEITGLRKNAPTVDLRIGICTGELVVGSIGAENTRSYTVMGDCVNLASRLESVNRVYGTNILIAEETARQLAPDIVHCEIDEVTVKGKTESTRIYEVLGTKGDLPPEIGQAKLCYAGALAAYRAQDWDQAEERFRQCVELRQGPGPANVFLTRIESLRQHPPGAGWTGVYHLDEK